MKNSFHPRICFIAGTLGQGGAERQLYYYVKTLKLIGYDPYILCLTEGDFWESHIRDLGVPIIWVGQSKSYFGRLISILTNISKKPAEIIHSQHFFTNLYAYIVSFILRKKSIASLRSNVYSEILSVGRWGKFCFQLPKNLVANSRSAIKNAVELGKPRDQLFYLPNVVDETLFSPVPNKKMSNQLEVIYGGSFRPAKRVDRVIRIARKCLDEGLNIHFKLYGDGENKADLINLAIESGVSNKNLEFMGVIANMSEAYREADVLLLTSDYEGTPNVVLEAMACGIPVISTRIGDVPELIEDGVNGYLVNFDDEQAFVNSLCKLMDPELWGKMSDANRNKILKERSLSLLSKQLIDLYSRVTIVS